MKTLHCLLFIVITFSLFSCRTSKDIQQDTPIETTPTVITETVIIMPEEKPTEEEQENETPELITESTVTKPIENNTMPKIVDIGNYTDADFHADFNTLLAENVSADGNVNYAGIKKNWSILRRYISSLGDTMPSAAWTTEDKLAYWMNAYNAMTIDLILRHQPIESIKDIKNPWDQRFWKLGEKYYNLDEIEHKILRKMDEPRIHFGINCASFSCPPLLNEAFTADTVDKQLDVVARKFINDSQRNTITADKLEVSEIFNWFGKDFKKQGSIIDYLNQYSNIKISENAKLRFKDYDWSLNK